MTHETFYAPINDRYFEDYIPGLVYEFGSIAVEEAEINYRMSPWFKNRWQIMYSQLWKTIPVCRRRKMSLTPSGRMKQQIYDDPFELDDWDMVIGAAVSCT